MFRFSIKISCVLLRKCQRERERLRKREREREREYYNSITIQDYKTIILAMQLVQT